MVKCKSLNINKKTQKLCFKNKYISFYHTERPVRTKYGQECTSLNNNKNTKVLFNKLYIYITERPISIRHGYGRLPQLVRVRP